MKKMTIVRLVLLACMTALLAAGCAKKPVVTDDPGLDGYGSEIPVVSEVLPQPEVTGIDERAVTERGYGEYGEAVPLETDDAAVAGLDRIQFDFDQYTLSVEARETLAKNAAYIQANPGVQVRIEGHCDERGADEYNLALGERRALAAMNYLVSLGISANQLSVISYGEELPLDPSTSEEAWAKNRRAEFKPLR